MIGQITVDMFMQVLIDCMRRLIHGQGYVKFFSNLFAIILQPSADVTAERFGWDAGDSQRSVSEAK